MTEVHTYEALGQPIAAMLQDSLNQADALLYEAKRTGRNRVCSAPELSPKNPEVKRDQLTDSDSEDKTLPVSVALKFYPTIDAKPL